MKKTILFCLIALLGFVMTSCGGAKGNGGSEVDAAKAVVEKYYEYYMAANGADICDIICDYALKPYNENEKDFIKDIFESNVKNNPIDKYEIGEAELVDTQCVFDIVTYSGGERQENMCIVRKLDDGTWRVVDDYHNL